MRCAGCIVTALRFWMGQSVASSPGSSPDSTADSQPESLRWAKAAARIADDKLGRGTVLIDVREVLGITDYFVITNGGNQRQVAAIVEAIEAQLAQQGGPRPYRIEGQADRSWVLADYVDFVVHVFDPQAREYYDLERLWKDQPYIDWAQ